MCFHWTSEGMLALGRAIHHLGIDFHEKTLPVWFVFPIHFLPRAPGPGFLETNDFHAPSFAKFPASSEETCDFQRPLWKLGRSEQWRQLEDQSGKGIPTEFMPSNCGGRTVLQCFQVSCRYSGTFLAEASPQFLASFRSLLSGSGGHQNGTRFLGLTS